MADEPKKDVDENPVKNDGGEKLLAGKYKSVDELEKGYSELETKLGQNSSEVSRLKAEMEIFKASKPVDEPPPPPETPAADALKAFKESVDPDLLTPKELVEFNEKLSRLTYREEQEQTLLTRQQVEHEEKSVQKKAESTLLKRDFDATRAQYNLNDEQMLELLEYAKQHNCAWISQAYEMRRAEQTEARYKGYNAPVKREFETPEQKIQKELEALSPWERQERFLKSNKSVEVFDELNQALGKV